MRDTPLGQNGWRTAARYRTIAEARIHDHLLLGGWAFEVRATPDESRREAAAALDHLVECGLPFRPTPEGRAFDPVEVLNFAKWVSLEQDDPFWTERFVRTGRRLFGRCRDADWPLLPQPPRRFALFLRRTFNLADVDRSRPLRLRLPLPIEDCNLDAIEVAVADTLPLKWQIAPDQSRVEVRGMIPADPSVSIAVKLVFTTHPDAVDRDPLDLSRYLETSEGFIQVTARVRALAAELAGRTMSARTAVMTFWNFMLDRLVVGAIHYDQVDHPSAATDWVLQTGWCDCQLGGALLAALCRAWQIPARLVSGYLLYPTTPTYHYWTEIWFDGEGWMPFDLLAWELSDGGRDPAWRNVFAGRLEPRLKTQCFPLRFTGHPGVPFPRDWHILTRSIEHGAETSFYAVGTGTLVYRDEVEVAWMDMTTEERAYPWRADGTTPIDGGISGRPSR